MSGIVQNNILRSSGTVAVSAAGLNWDSTILTALTTLTVTVQNVGGNKYFINGVQQDTLNLLEGFTYKFDQSDSSNSGHPLRFSTTSGGTHSGGSEYTTGVTTNGTPGNAGAYTQIVVAANAPVLYYYCTNHNYMGGTANTTAETVESNNGYWIDTTSTTCTITLPSSAEKGDQIVLIDYARTWGTNNIVINSNGLNYQGSADTFTLEYTTDGQSINIVYSDSTKGWIPLEDDVVAEEPAPPVTQKGIFAYGQGASAKVSMSNLINSSGVVASDVTGVGTARAYLAGASYGTDKAIFGFGTTGSNTGVTNLVNSSGVIASDVSAVGTARNEVAASAYGGDKAIFGFGTTGSATNITNLVNNSGVVQSDVSGVGTAKNNPSACGFGGDKGIFGYGTSGTSNIVNNSGVLQSDVTASGTTGVTYRAAATYGIDKGIFGYGVISGKTSHTNLVSNVGVISADVSGVGTARGGSAACSYGGDKAIFGYGDNSGRQNMTNLVNNLGVVSSDVSGVGTARTGLAAAGYSLSA